MIIPNPLKLIDRLEKRVNRCLLDPEAIETILVEFGILIVKAVQVSSGDFVHDSTSYLVKAKVDRYILRISDVSCEGGALVYEHSILAYLHTKEMEVPQPIRTRDGKTFIAINGKYYTLFYLIPGYCYRDYVIPLGEKIKYIRQAGEVLGKIHINLRGYSPDRKKRWRGCADANRMLRKCYDVLTETGSIGDEDVYFVENYNYLGEMLLVLEKKYASFHNLPRCIIHEDFGPHNLLFKNGRLSGILDFMDAHVDWRARDVIYSLSVFACTRIKRYDENLVKIFLDGYQLFSDIYMDELDCMVDMLCLKRLCEIPYYLNAYYIRKGDAKYLRMFSAFVEEIRWHQDNENLLIGMLRKYIRQCR